MATSQTLGSITVSAGIAMAPRNGSDEESIVAAADEALYASKRQGRDRVTIAWHDTPVVTG
jgi:GGDEF domain-containing protein